MDTGVRCHACGGNVSVQGACSSGAVHHVECSPDFGVSSVFGSPTEIDRLRRLATKLYEQWLDALPYVGSFFLSKHGHADTAASIKSDIPWLGDNDFVRKLIELAEAELAADGTKEDTAEWMAAWAKVRALGKELCGE